MYLRGAVLMGKVKFKLPDDLLERADLAADINDGTRKELFKDALVAYLDDLEEQDAYRKAVIEKYLDDAITFDVLKGLLGRQDAEAIKASKTLLEGGDTVASDLADEE